MLITTCSQPDTGPTSPSESKPVGRSLTLAIEGEIEGEVYVNGQPLSNAGDYSIELVPKTGRTIYEAHGDDKKIKKSPPPDDPDSLVSCQSFSNCNSFAYNAGIQGELSGNIGNVWDGVYTARLTTPTDVCTVDIAHNHVDSNGTNGEFMDETAGDQKIRFFLTSSGFCDDEEVELFNGNPGHSIASSQLSATISAPDTVGINETFTATATASGGFGSGRRYAFDFTALGGTNEENFSGTDLSTSNSAQHSYSQTGTYKVRAVVRDGDDDEGHGGNYALSSEHTVRVVPDYDAKAAGNTLPSTVDYATWYATSVSMTNVGSVTWSGSSIELDQANPVNFWLPDNGVGLGGSSVALNQTKTFNFNLKTLEPEYCGNQSNYWRVELNGSGFGQSNGRTTYVDDCPGASLDFLRSLWAWLEPAVAMASGPRWMLAVFQEEVVQVLRKEDYPLVTRDVEAAGEFRIRYVASLREDSPWDVDFRFHIKFDANAFEVGTVVRGARGNNYRVQTELVSPGEVVVRADRLDFRGLSGTGLILEIPLVLKPGAQAPATLELIELITTK